MTDAEVALWTALAAGIGSAISGVVAVVVTRRQVRSTENMSRETRYQDRILKAYLTTQMFLGLVTSSQAKAMASFLK